MPPTRTPQAPSPASWPLSVWTSPVLSQAQPPLVSTSPPVASPSTGHVSVVVPPVLPVPTLRFSSTTQATSVLTPPSPLTLVTITLVYSTFLLQTPPPPTPPPPTTPP